MAKRQVYISGALTGNNVLYEKLREEFEKYGFEAYTPQNRKQLEESIKTATTKECQAMYESNAGIIAKSALVVAYVGAPSLEVGAELEKANAFGIPILLIYERMDEVNPSIKGIPMVKQRFEFQNLSNIPLLVGEYMIEYAKK